MFLNTPVRESRRGNAPYERVAFAKGFCRLTKIEAIMFRVRCGCLAKKLRCPKRGNSDDSETSPANNYFGRQIHFRGVINRFYLLLGSFST